MDYCIRPATQADEPFLWTMLYYAAHMSEDTETSSQAAHHNPRLAKYVIGWGRRSDLGFIALDDRGHSPIGAVWARVFSGDNTTHGFVEETPELAIASFQHVLGKALAHNYLKRSSPQHQASILPSHSRFEPIIPRSVCINGLDLSLWMRLSIVLEPHRTPCSTDFMQRTSLYAVSKRKGRRPHAHNADAYVTAPILLVHVEYLEQ
jgi:hypothetical protein